MTLATPQTNQAVLEIVQAAVADALGLSTDEVTPEAALLDDLGAESIDLLDILFRIERTSGIKIKAADIGTHIQGGIPDEAFADEQGMVSAVGLAHLQTVMPQIDPDAMAGKLHGERILYLFSVQNLADMVGARMA